MQFMTPLNEVQIFVVVGKEVFFFVSFKNISTIGFRKQWKPLHGQEEAPRPPSG